jgi:hypothetical protein
MIQRPGPTEYAEYYTDYIHRVPEGDICAILEGQLAELRDVYSRFSDVRAAQPRVENEWSPKQVLGHLCDGERVFGYRALCISRGDTTPLPGFEQDDYVREAHSNARQLTSLIAEFEHLRRANVILFRSISDEASERLGTASDYPVTVRAIAYMLAGHAGRHLQLLRERYAAVAGG